MFRLPIIGGSDGGLYTCAEDLDMLWRALFAGRVLSECMLKEFLRQQVIRSDDSSYGLSVYRKVIGSETIYYAVGGDFGVDFLTAYFPSQKLTVSALGNTEVNTFPLRRKMFEEMKPREGEEKFAFHTSVKILLKTAGVSYIPTVVLPR